MRKIDGHTTQRLRSARTLAPSSRGACMVVISGQRLGQCIDLHDVPVVIGRAPGSDFQIEHRSVSRAHCKVYHDGGKFYVRDLGSTNKTLVNGRPAAETVLKDGDLIAVGETVLKFVRRGSLEARYHEALYELATVDSLTQLYNRRKFRELIEECMTRAVADGSALALLFIDLDRFKAINDRHGHLAGDEVLRGIARTVREQLVKPEFAGRLGGEEFAIALPGATMARAQARAETLRAAIEAARTEHDGISHGCTASIGVSVFGSDAPTVSDLMRAADLQLFRAKAEGRNRVCATPARTTA
ncbi:MAG TPA: GGDEF domain-containing protein [Candidatus Saccharimonadia bacterium]|nr:GGDEF domain-containing protein [Candidatus Saccharimonadia bacterium]